MVKMVTIPTIICKKINSKLLGTINPSNNTVSTWVNNPSLASKKAFKTKGNITIGAKYTNLASYFTIIVNWLIK